jgi:membrane protein YdbS with pleckstrin-like domain
MEQTDLTELQEEELSTIHTHELTKIDPNAVWVWRMNGFLWIPVYLIPLYIVVFNWWDLESPWLMLGGASVLVAVIIYVFAWWLPMLRWRYWWYMVDENYILLRHGIVFKREVVIPFSRVQLVDTSNGPIMRAYDLSNVSISTAGGDNAIPGLPVEEAETLRNYIANEAHLHDVDV